jgi:hypothetical protein
MNKPADDSVFKKYSEIMPAVVASVFVLSPGILGLIRPPYVIQWVLFAAWVMLITALGFLGFAWIRTMMHCLRPPIRTLGLGNCLAFAALLLLAIYTQTNLAEDLLAAPRITAVHVNPLVVEPGGNVELSVEVEDQDGDALDYQWFSGKLPIGHLRTIYFSAPGTEGIHTVEVRISDGLTVVTERASVAVRAVAAIAGCRAGPSIIGGT